MSDKAGRLTQGSLFDGFGGMRRGFEDAGFQTKWTVDLLNGQDITGLDAADFERVDLISGGPPCQRGSELAKFAKSRTFVTLWPEMLRFVAALRPAWVVVENVPGFQRQMVDWTAELYGLGYGCAGQFVDSRHWVPQQRTRAFIVARLGAEPYGITYTLQASENHECRGVDTVRKRMSRAAKGEVPKRATYSLGPCDECLPRGILTRNKAIQFALMGAGNAVTQPVAKYIAQRIMSYQGTANHGPKSVEGKEGEHG